MNINVLTFFFAEFCKTSVIKCKKLEEKFTLYYL